MGVATQYLIRELCELPPSCRPPATALQRGCKPIAVSILSQSCLSVCDAQARNPWLILSSQHLGSSESQKLFSTLCALASWREQIQTDLSRRNFEKAEAIQHESALLNGWK